MAAGGGGSWKVAYADFITALMAFFLVMWIVNQNQQVTGSVESYFKNPWRAAVTESTGIIPVKNASVVQSQKANFENPSMIELEMVRRINEDLVKTFIQNKSYRENPTLQVELTPDGVLINFLDDPSKPLFETDKSDPNNPVEKFTEWGEFIFRTVAWEIGRFRDTTVQLEGHTEDGFKPIRTNYTAWEVSTERANLARRKLMENNVAESQITKVAGYAGTKPGKTKDLKTLRDPKDPANRRVSVLINAKIGG